jgi:hypothetical protein
MNHRQLGFDPSSGHTRLRWIKWRRLSVLIPQTAPSSLLILSSTLQGLDTDSLVEQPSWRRKSNLRRAGNSQMSVQVSQTAVTEIKRGALEKNLQSRRRLLEKIKTWDSNLKPWNNSSASEIIRTIHSLEDKKIKVRIYKLFYMRLYGVSV